MTATLEAPRRMKGRDQARALLEGLGTTSPGDQVIIRFQEGSRPTTSFLVQLVGSLAVERGVYLVFENLDEFARRIVMDDASDNGVADLVQTR